MVSSSPGGRGAQEGSNRLVRAVTMFMFNNENKGGKKEKKGLLLWPLWAYNYTFEKRPQNTCICKKNN